MIGAGATSPSVLGAAFLIATCTFPTVLANASEPQAPHPCVREEMTTVCNGDHPALRVVEETTSPSGRYAMAWVVPEDAASIARLERDSADGSMSLPGGEPENVVVRLRDGAVIAHAGSTHFGDHELYNYAELSATWSADETRLTTRQNDRWDTLAADVFRLDRNGKLMAHGDLLAIVRRVGRQHLARRKHANPIEAYEAHIVAESFDRGNRMEIKTVLQIPGTDEPGFYFKMKVRLDEDEIRVVDAGVLRR